MILCLDLGNTDLKAALFNAEGERVSEIRRPKPVHADPAFVRECLSPLLQKGTPSKSVLSSVVPELNDAFREALPGLHVVDHKSPWGFTLSFENVETVGHDRLCNMEGALRYGGYAIVVDAGTATKFDVLEGAEKKSFVGGAIAPGLGISFSALIEGTAQLPEISLDKFSPVVGYNTETAIRSGVLHGFASEVDGMILRIFEERKLPALTSVIATGGYSRYLQARARLITRYVPNLTLEGLHGLARKL